MSCVICYKFSLKKYENEKKNSLYTNSLTETIILIINLITPKRNISCSFISDSTQNHPELENEPKYRIPRRIYELFPKFFNVFLENKELIDDIILSKDIKIEDFVIYKHFPELIDFQVRLNKFLIKEHDKINKYQRKHLSINTEIILADSYEELGNASVDIWKRTISISYLNMRGIDLGGLRRDWFTKLARELFDPKTGFFQTSGESLCLQPSPLSIKIPNYKNYFVFAGRFIARVIMVNISVNVHFTTPFLKQILGHTLRMSDLDSIDKNYRT